MTHDVCIFVKLEAIYVMTECPRWLRRQTWLPRINAGTNPDQNFYLLLISRCFTSTNFGLKVRIFLIIKRLKVSFRVDISKILVHAVIPHDSAQTWKMTNFCPVQILASKSQRSENRARKHKIFDYKKPFNIWFWYLNFFLKPKNLIFNT